MSPDPYLFYASRVNEIKAEIRTQTRSGEYFGWLRLGTFVAGIASAWLARHISIWAIIMISLVFLTVFLAVVIKDQKIRNRINFLQRLLHINENELQVLSHRFTDLPDGMNHSQPDHPYALDLDIFGRASAFQLINRCSSEQGQQLLAQYLVSPGRQAEILQRQAAGAELAKYTIWIQELLASASVKPISIATEQRIKSWLSEEPVFSGRVHWSLIRYLVPFLSCGSLLAYLLGYISDSGYTLLFILFMAFGLYISNRVTAIYSKLNGINAELESLSAITSAIGNSKFSSEKLTRIKEQLSVGLQGAAVSTRELQGILNRFDYRLNWVVFIPLNTLLLWDLQQVIQLEKWRAAHRSHVAAWYQAAAEIEVLCSIGTLIFNNPDWVLPDIEMNGAMVSGNDIGHPLIEKRKRVTNHFTVDGNGNVSIITGSNMAGKSTFLRSIGLNIVMAGMGAPVCATRFVCRPVMIMSSMRIKDNLEENLSTFHAELNKLRTIIEASNQHAPVFILLDEMLRGTNSHDRQSGSKALVRQLVRHHATAMVATHDLELASLQEEFPEYISNYHFDVRITDGELMFDYKLRTGICKTFNAALLMRKIGIEI